MDVKWVKIRSWHAVRGGFGPGWATTFCGRLSHSLPKDDLPAEKSCESCLRIVARLNDVR